LPRQPPEYEPNHRHLDERLAGLHLLMYDALFACCEEVDADENVRVLVLRGAGEKAFVAGTDIKQFLEFKSGEDGISYEERMERVVGRLERVRSPPSQ
jgi:enoyl-CoA hydratase/carnithine racemase